MTFALHSRIRENTTSEGTGDLVLDGAVTGYGAFADRYSDGDTMFVGVAMGSDWEIFLGTYNSGANSISRTTMYASTNADAEVSWGAGTKNIFVTNPGRDDLDTVGKSKLATFETGDMKYRAGVAAHDGWVRANGRTIGSAASGATERANADTQPLYEFLWAAYSNSVAAVSSGRGASAAADFAANKTLTLPDAVDRMMASLDNAGNGVKSRITSTTQASDNSGGAETVAIAQANLPAVSLSVSGTAAGAGLHDHAGTTLASRYGGTVDHLHAAGGSRVAGPITGGSDSVLGQTAFNWTAAPNHTHSVTGTTENMGSGTAVDKMPPFIALGTWHFKL